MASTDLSQLPDAVLAALLNSSGLHNTDLLALRSACPGLRRAVDAAHARDLLLCANAGQPGPPPSQLAALVQRFKPHALTFGTQAGFMSSDSSSELRQHLADWSAQSPPAALRWGSVRTLRSCPSSCATPLAALCPNLEEVQLEVDNPQLLPEAVGALSVLTGLQALTIAARSATRSGRPRAVGSAEQAWPALGALTGLRSLKLDCGGFVEGAGMALATLTSLSELRLWCGRRVAALPADIASTLQKLVLSGMMEEDFYDGNDEEIRCSDDSGADYLFSKAPGHLARQLDVLEGLPLGALTELHLRLDTNSYPIERHLGSLGPFEASLLLVLSLGQSSYRYLDNKALEALAAGCPRLAALEANELTADDSCTAVFPELRTLFAGLTGAPPLHRMAPNLRTWGIGCSDWSDTKVLLSAFEAAEDLHTVVFISPLTCEYYGDAPNRADPINPYPCLALAAGYVKLLELAEPLDQCDFDVEPPHDSGSMFSFVCRDSCAQHMVLTGGKELPGFVATVASRMRLPTLELRFKADRSGRLEGVERAALLAMGIEGLAHLTLSFPREYTTGDIPWDNMLSAIATARPLTLREVVFVNGYGVTWEAVMRAQACALERGPPLSISKRRVWDNTPWLGRFRHYAHS